MQSMLDLIKFRLTQTGIKCVQLQGNMTLDKRDKAINAFSNDPDVTVFLMSLKAGGVALNLTAGKCIVVNLSISLSFCSSGIIKRRHIPDGSHCSLLQQPRIVS